VLYDQECRKVPFSPWYQTAGRDLTIRHIFAYRYFSHMSSLSSIAAQVESRIPGAFRKYERTPGELLPTGIPAVDECGIRTAALTQICSPPGCTSARTSILVSVLARATASDHFCALVDPSDSFDPVGASAAVTLERLLWVRCSERKGSNNTQLTPLEKAFKAADIILQNGGFRLIAVDLADFDEATVRKVPMTTWFRFARVVEKTDTALVFLLAYPAAQSCAGLTLETRTVNAVWEESCVSHGRLLVGTKHELMVRRRQDKKSPSSETSEFEIARWAHY
jgi:recombination protein RecA